jgi:hypothetical protein
MLAKAVKASSGSTRGAVNLPKATKPGVLAGLGLAPQATPAAHALGVVVWVVVVVAYIGMDRNTIGQPTSGQEPPRGPIGFSTTGRDLVVF